METQLRAEKERYCTLTVVDEVLSARLVDVDGAAAFSAALDEQ